MRRLALSLSALALCTGADAPPETATHHVIVGPNWIAKPDGKKLSKVYPATASKLGIGGHATMECDSEIDGGLDHCVILEETPSGMGFGAAMLDLAPSFRMQPGTSDGVPFASRVHIPFTFAIEESRHHGGPGVVQRYESIPWEAAPSRAELEAVRPKGVDKGATTLFCSFGQHRDLIDCRAVVEDPRGKGLGDAALKLIHQFTAMDLSAGKPAARDQVFIVVRFDKPSSPYEAQPAWRVLPDQAASDAAFPDAARSAHVAKGSAAVDCGIGARGALSDCRVLSESRAGLGFGAAGLKLAPLYALSAWSSDGRPEEGQRVRFTIEFSDARGR